MAVRSSGVEQMNKRVIVLQRAPIGSDNWKRYFTALSDDVNEMPTAIKAVEKPGENFQHRIVCIETLMTEDDPVYHEPDAVRLERFARTVLNVAQSISNGSFSAVNFDWSEIAGDAKAALGE